MTLSFSNQVKVPRGPRHLVTRERLLVPLIAALDRRVVTIVAPGGAGKSSLLANVARDAEFPVCWVSLDEWLADPTELVAVLASAAESVVPGLAAA